LDETDPEVVLPIESEIPDIAFLSVTSGAVVGGGDSEVVRKLASLWAVSLEHGQPHLVHRFFGPIIDSDPINLERLEFLPIVLPDFVKGHIWGNKGEKHDILHFPLVRLPLIANTQVQPSCRLVPGWSRGVSIKKYADIELGLLVVRQTALKEGFAVPRSLGGIPGFQSLFVTQKLAPILALKCWSRADIDRIQEIAINDNRKSEPL